MRTALAILSLSVLSAACSSDAEDELPPNTVDECVAFCEAAMACRLESGADEIARVVDPTRTAMCAWNDEGAARYACVEACSPLVGQADGPSRACLRCRAAGLEASCPTRPWRFEGCDSECESPESERFWFELPQRSALSCWGAEPTETTVPSACNGGSVDPRIRFSAVSPDEFRSVQTTATGTVSSVSPLTIEIASAPPMQVELPGVPSAGLTTGTPVVVAVARDCPFGCWTQSVVLRDATTQELLIATWNAVTTGVPTLPELDLSYASRSCPSTAEQCGIQAPLSLRASDGNTSEIADAGTTTTVGAYDIGNGASHANLLWQCTDTPPTFTSGYVTKSTP